MLNQYLDHDSELKYFPFVLLTTGIILLLNALTKIKNSVVLKEGLNNFNQYFDECTVESIENIKSGS